MSNWHPVSDFVAFTTKGITPKYVNNSSVVVLNQKCIRDNKINYSFAQFTNDSQSLPKNKFVQNGDILVNSTGTGTAGRCAFVSKLPEDRRLIVDSHILILRCRSYPEAQCLSYILFSFEQKLMEFMTGSSGQSELDKIVLLNLKTNLTRDLDSQRKIANILSRIDSKIELNNEINAELEQMAKTLYDYWFVQFDFPDINGKPYKSSGGKMIWSEELKREIPEGWVVGTLSDISNLYRGVSYGKNDIKCKGDMGVIPILRATNITGNTVDLNNMVYVPSKFVSQKQLLNKFDIIITMSSGSKDHIGKNAYYYFEDIVGFGAFCAKIVAKENYKYYLYSFTQSDFMFSTIRNECLGTNINNLNSAMVNGFKIIIPPSGFIRNFNTLVASSYSVIANNQIESKNLTEIRDWLLPMLMNGQVKVN